MNESRSNDKKPKKLLRNQNSRCITTMTGITKKCHDHQTRRSCCFLFLLLLLLLLLLIQPFCCSANNDHPSNNIYSDDDDFHNPYNNKKKKDTTTNNNKKKNPKNQIKQNNKMIQQIIKASNQSDHYGVLGIHNIEITILPEPITISFIQPTYLIQQYLIQPIQQLFFKQHNDNNTIKTNKNSTNTFANQNPFFTITIPSIKLFPTSMNTIKKAYRTRAKYVHPDKNIDPNNNPDDTVIAFRLLDESTNFLLNPSLRQQYDKKIQQQRIQSIQSVQQKIQQTIRTSIQSTLRCIHTIRTLLGPFAFPVTVLGVLVF